MTAKEETASTGYVSTLLSLDISCCIKTGLFAIIFYNIF